MVLAAGLTSRRAPESFSRRVIEAALAGSIELVVTETLLAETRAVLTNSHFGARRSHEEADALIAVLRIAAGKIIEDRDSAPPRRCADPDDDYLVDAAITTGATLVSRDDRARFSEVPGLDSCRPGTALRLAGFLTD